MSIFQKVADINLKLLGMQIPMSGYNTHKRYPYYELVDIIPVLTKECYEKRLSFIFPYADDVAILKIVNLDDPKDYIVYRLVFPELITEQGNPNNKLIQAYGANITYLQRYLLKLAFPALSDKDFVDADDINVDGASSANIKEENKEPLNRLLKDAINKLKHKGLKGKEINFKSITNTIYRMNKFSDEEKEEIADFVRVYCKAKFKKGGNRK